MKLKTRIVAGISALLFVATSAFNAGAITTDLHTAVKGGDIEKVKTLCQEHPEWINEPDECLWKPLCYAVQYNNSDVSKYLIEHGADATSGLIRAAWLGRSKLAKYFVDHGADPNAGLVAACARDNTDLIKYLVEHRADATDCLWYFAAGDNVEFVKYLVEHGADITCTDYFGDTILHQVHDLDMAKYLVSQGAPIGSTPYSFLGCSEDLTKYLVEHGATIGEDVVSAVASDGNLDLVKYLVEKGAKIDDHVIYDAVYSENIALVKYIVECGTDVNVKNDKGDTLLSELLDYIVVRENRLKETKNENQVTNLRKRIENFKSIAAYLRSQGAHE